MKNLKTAKLFLLLFCLLPLALTGCGKDQPAPPESAPVAPVQPEATATESKGALMDAYLDDYERFVEKCELIFSRPDVSDAEVQELNAEQSAIYARYQEISQILSMDDITPAQLERNDALVQRIMSLNQDPS